jgi:Putative bacterial sensory transduction regulator
MRILVLIAVLGGCLLMNVDHSFGQLGPKQGGAAGQQAAGQVVSRITPEQLATVLTQAGMRSQVATTQDGQKYVKVSVGELKSPYVALGNCNNQGCGDLLFGAYFNADPNVTADNVNAWNAQYRFAKVYLDSDGGVAFELDMTLAGGVTLENIKENGRLFAALLTKYYEGE